MTGNGRVNGFVHSPIPQPMGSDGSSSLGTTPTNSGLACTSSDDSSQKRSVESQRDFPSGTAGVTSKVAATIAKEKQKSKRSGKDRRVLGNRRVTCSRCYKKKVRCSFGNPCERCARDGVECVYEVTYPGYQQQMLVVKANSLFISRQNFDAVVARYAAQVTGVILPVVSISDLYGSFDVWEAVRGSHDVGAINKVTNLRTTNLPGSSTSVVSWDRGQKVMSKASFLVLISFAMGCRFCHNTQISRTKILLDLAMDYVVDILEDMISRDEKSEYYFARGVYFIAYLYRSANNVFTITAEDQARVLNIQALLLKTLVPLQDPLCTATLVGCTMALRRLDLAPLCYDGLLRGLAEMQVTTDVERARAFCNVLNLGCSVLTWGCLVKCGEWIAEVHMYNFSAELKWDQELLQHLSFVVQFAGNYLASIQELFPFFSQDQELAIPTSNMMMVLGYGLWRLSRLNNTAHGIPEAADHALTGLQVWWMNRERGVHPLDSTMIGNATLAVRVLSESCPLVCSQWFKDTSILTGEFNGKAEPETDVGQIAHAMLLSVSNNLVSCP